MSYNIDSVDILSSDGFGISTQKLKMLIIDKDCEDQMPEDNFSDDIDFDSEIHFQPNRFGWCGEGSGHSEELFKELLAEFDGSADLLLTWEGGDSHSGLRLRNHVVTEHEVEFRLKD